MLTVLAYFEVAIGRLLVSSVVSMVVRYVDFISIYHSTIYELTVGLMFKRTILKGANWLFFHIPPYP